MPFSAARSTPPTRSCSPPLSPERTSRYPPLTGPVVTDASHEPALAHDPHDGRAAVGLHRGFGNANALDGPARPRALAPAPSGSRKSTLRAHLREDARIVIGDRHLHLHRRALPVGGGHDLPRHAAKGRVGIGVERDARRPAAGDAPDVRLVHVHLDLERREIGHRHHGAAREPAAHRRRDDLADLRVLAQHGAGERRADDRVLVASPPRAAAPPRRSASAPRRR